MTSREEQSIGAEAHAERPSAGPAAAVGPVPSGLLPAPVVDGLAKKRVAYIDSLRGIAILGVIFVHTAEICSPPICLMPYIGMGARGVQLFYVISAFTLFQSLSSRPRSSDPAFMKYALRRVFRIVPMFYFAVALYLLIEGFGPRFWAPDGINATHVLLTLLFINGWYPSTINSVVPGGWSVAIEMTFYLLVPLLFLYVNSLAKAVRMFIIFAVGCFFLDDYAYYRYSSLCPSKMVTIVNSFCYNLWLPAQVSVFLEGVVLYFLLTSRHLRALASRNASLTLMCVLGFLIWCMDRGDELPGLPTQTLFGGVFVLLAIALAWHPWRLLVNGITVYLGRISYSMYLLHFAVIRLLLWHPHVWGPLGSWRFAVALLALLLATVLAASITYRLVELPGQALGLRLSRFWLGSDRGAAP